MKTPAPNGTGSSMKVEDILPYFDFRTMFTDLNSHNKTLCPFHQEKTPSFLVDIRRAHCFGCGWDGDVLDFLQQTEGLSFQDALKELERRAGVVTGPRHKPASKPKATVNPCYALPLPEGQVLAFWHRLEALKQVPDAVVNRGFTLDDCKALGIVSSGPDAVLAITNPYDQIVAFKRRYAIVREGETRYSYITEKVGTPSWCSPLFQTAQKIMIVEGELNAMSICLARRNNDPDIAFMGIAGTHGQMWLEALKDKTVYLYCDGDKPGQDALERWAKAAHDAGAKEVYELSPLPDPQDFNDVLVNEGRDALREILLCLP